MVLAIVMIFGADYAMAQNYAVAIDGSKPFESVVELFDEGRITFDIYLEDAPGHAYSGGAWVDFRGFTDKLSYVSAGRALTDGSEGVTGPWDPAAGMVVNEPNGTGTLMIVVGQLDEGGASPDGDGDIIVARVTLECTALGITNISLSTIPGIGTWSPVPPYDDSAITNATPNPTLVIHQCVFYDSDEDGFSDANDNCPNNYNPNQEDTCPPGGNGIGDACDCECDFNCDGNVDATDVTDFLGDFGRSTFFNPCTNDDPCSGDVDCNVNVDADDVTRFLTDFGRSQFNNPCPPCVTGNWCVYE